MRKYFIKRKEEGCYKKNLNLATFDFREHPNVALNYIHLERRG